MQTEDQRLTIPKLLADGTNWVIYRDRVVWALGANGLDIHLTEDTPPEDFLTEGVIGGLEPEARWRKQDGMVKSLIGTSCEETSPCIPCMNISVSFILSFLLQYSELGSA